MLISLLVGVSVVLIAGHIRHTRRVWRGLNQTVSPQWLKAHLYTSGTQRTV